MPWPLAVTEESFSIVRRDEERLGPGIAELCRRHGAEDPPVRFADGSLPVYAVGPEVLKVYPPVYAEERAREHLVLEVLAGRLPIPTPRPLGTGVFEGWGYLWMDRLRGESLAARWPAVGDDGPRLARAVGECLAALHAVEDSRLAALDGDWDGFVAEQRRTCVARQRARGLDAHWLGQIPAFLDELSLEGAPALLHTEVMREHLLVADTPSVLTGLFDFEPAMWGAPEYELASVGLFVSCGDPALLRELLLGYGRREDELGPELERRLLGYALLHRFSNFPWYLRRVPPPAGTGTLDELARVWFGT